MADSTLNRFLASGTAAERAAFTPTPPTPASGPDCGYFWYETDTGDTYAWDGAAWDKVNTASLADGDYGDITISGSGATWTIDDGTVSLAKMADMATASVIYRKTAGTGVPEVQTLATLKTDLGLTGTNSGDQTSIVGITGTIAEFNTACTDADFATGGGTATGTNTGDQTSIVGISGTLAQFNTACSDADFVPTGAITSSGLTMATARFLGRTTAATGAVEELTAASAKTLLAITASDVSGLATIATSGSAADLTGTVALANGGTGAALVDPNADRLLFWDDSAGAVTWLTLGTNLTITGTTLDAAGGGGLADGDYGDITVGGTGTTMTIDNDAVTYAKMQNVSATDRLLGRDTAAAGDVEELTVGGGVEFTGSGGIQTSAFTGDVTKAAGGTALTLASNQKLRTITYVIDGGGSAITTGLKGFLEVPFACTINSWTILADQSGSIVVDVWKDTYANFPPTVADTIAGTEKPTLSAAQKNQDTSLSTWTTSVSAGDILAFNVDSATTVTRVTLSITVTAT